MKSIAVILANRDDCGVRTTREECIDVVYSPSPRPRIRGADLPTISVTPPLPFPIELREPFRMFLELLAGEHVLDRVSSIPFAVCA